MSCTRKIAIVEDDETIRDLLLMTLRAAGFKSVVAASRGDDGLEMVMREPPDILLLDLMLPGLDGVSLCRRLRGMKDAPRLGIIMLTARGEAEDIVEGLDAGADDYIVKPFSRSVLLARINALVRRMEPSAGRELDGLVVDEAAGRAALDGRTLSLTRTEFALLSRFVANPARVFTRRRLSEIAGGSGEGERTVDVQIAGLRKKLGGWARHLETVRGVGYRIVE
jgi:two-component system phosphate regulon response regulator PhoB